MLSNYLLLKNILDFEYFLNYFFTMMKSVIVLFIAIVINTSLRGQDIKEIAKVGIKSTVSIVALDKNSQPLALGSGFIIDNELIATNVHVIEGSSSAYVLVNGEEKKYKVDGYVAIDKGNDLVILKVPNLYGKALTLGSETIPEIGEKVFAVGNPKGLDGTFSEGIISGVRTILTKKVIQITTPISPGSSGGPVLNSSEKVIGIAFASFTEGQNLNFAIPVIYLIKLKNAIGIVTLINTIKPTQKNLNTTKINNKEGVEIRNISYENNEIYSFSIKNNLPNKISDIKVLFISYDATGTIVDYREFVFFETTKYSNQEIAPFMAKTLDYENYFRYNYDNNLSIHIVGKKVKARLLNYKILED